MARATISSLNGHSSSTAPPPRADGADVMEAAAGGRGDDANAHRKRGQGALAGLVEQAFRRQLLLQPLELRLSRADPRGLHEIDDELDVAALLAVGDAAGRPAPR